MTSINQFQQSKPNSKSQSKLWNTDKKV